MEILAGAVGLIIGALGAWAVASRRIARLEADRARAEAEARGAQQLREAFGSIAADALRASLDEFLKLAGQRVEDIDARRAAIEKLMEPVNAALAEVHQGQGSLAKNLDRLHGDQAALQNETHKLAEALRSTRHRGRWGELSLRKLAELAGMVEHCDFAEQEAAGDKMPDLRVMLPAGRVVAVDAKVPWDAYQQAFEAKSEEDRVAAFKRHAALFRSHVKKLSEREYWKKLDSDFDLTVMFVPNDSFVSAAAEHDAELIEFALRRRVVVATPSTLVALLRAIELGWREQRLAENAEKIQDAGRKVHERMATLMSHVLDIGKGLGGAVKAYNDASGSLQRLFVPAVRDFAALGAGSEKKIPETPPLENVDQSGAA